MHDAPVTNKLHKHHTAGHATKDIARCNDTTMNVRTEFGTCLQRCRNIPLATTFRKDIAMLVAFLVGFTIAVFAIEPEAAPPSSLPEQIEATTRIETAPVDSTLTPGT